MKPLVGSPRRPTAVLGSPNYRGWFSAPAHLADRH
ncbi:Uncharacterised protein [Vibrio cholerae]|nr:Uncharacterised protein [Vibrio cholerae]